MHCPNCGQQQASPELKFCSRCGFPLGLIAEVLAHGGFLPRLAELNKKKTIFTKKNGVMVGVFWMILFMMLIPSIIGIAGGPDEAMGITAVIGVFGGMMMIIASLVFLQSSKQSPFVPQHMPPSTAPQGLYGANQAALPPQQSIPTSAYSPPHSGSWRDTKDLEPSSVTESTTRLLEKEERDQ